MAKPDKTKHQRITDFDFSVNGAHVAIVDKAANGVEDFLVVKNLGTEEVESKKNLDNTSGVSDKPAEVDSVNKSKSETKETPMTDENKAPEVADNSAEVALMAKALEEQQAKAEEMTKALEANQAKLEAFEKAAEAREAAEWLVKAEGYKELGCEAEKAAPVLRALDSLEGSEEVFKMLDAAKDLISKEEMTKEVGKAGELDGNAGLKAEKAELIKKAVEAGATQADALMQVINARPDLYEV